MKVLVVCFGNTCRSPMLEALLNRDLRKLEKQITVESCGVLNKQDNAGANPHSITCMDALHLDIRNHRRRYAGDLDLANYARIYVMAGSLKDELVTLGAPADRIEVLCKDSNGVPNPFDTDLPVDEQDLAKYFACAEVLDQESGRIAASL